MMQRRAAEREKVSANVNECVIVVMDRWERRGGAMCVVTDGLDSKEQAERTGVTAFLHEPGPHVGARGEFPLPDLHLFLEPKSYIGTIASVRLISLSSSAILVSISM